MFTLFHKYWKRKNILEDQHESQAASILRLAKTLSQDLNQIIPRLISKDLVFIKGLEGWWILGFFF